MGSLLAGKIDIDEYRNSLSEIISLYGQIEAGKKAQASLLAQQYEAAIGSLSDLYQALPHPKPPSWTIPSIFRKPHDENFISNYLAYILDPKKNGIGNQPLEKLIALLSGDDELLPGQKIEVIREYPLQERRIDILIFIGDELVIGLENKIFASESDGQTTFYAKVMDQVFKDRKRIYGFLTIDGKAATCNQFQALSYLQLLTAFQSIEFPKEDIRKRAFWEDFLLHIEEHLTVNSSKNDIPNPEKLALYIKHYEMLNDLQSAYENAREAIFISIVQDIQQSFGSLDWKFDFNPVRPWQLMYKPYWYRTEPPIRVIWVLWFTRDVLLQKEMSISIEVQGYGNKWDTEEAIPQFFNIFHPRFQNIKEVYREKGMEYLTATPGRPQLAKLGIARKRYTLSFDPDKVETISKSIIQAIEEFTFLINPIDETLMEFNGLGEKDLISEPGS